MRGLQLEYIAKGVFLGLLLFVALETKTPDDTERVAYCMFGGLAVAVVVAGLLQLREGHRIQGRLFPFFLFLLLENPTLVYAGILLGLYGGARCVEQAGSETLMLGTVGGGAVLGFVFGLLRDVPNRWTRMGLILLLAAGLPAAGLYWLHINPTAVQYRPLLGAELLIGIPFFYLLTFAGRAEESEVEIAAICAALSASLILLDWMPRGLRSLAIVVPFMLYLAYVIRVLPGLRVFKHAIRGHSYVGVGRNRDALRSFRRALQLSPENRIARRGVFAVHRTMDLSQVVNDPEMLALVDFDICMERASTLLMEKPSDASLKEANHLLELIENQRPALRPVVRYWRTVALLHQRQPEHAAEALTSILDPGTFGADDVQRQAVLFQAWQLAAMGHPEMQKRVGASELEKPGRRIEAIAAVERRLGVQPDDAGAWDFKRILYSNLTEAEHQAAAGDAPLPYFDYGYAQQLGLALISDAGRWQRGAEYLRIAAHGLRILGPAIFVQIAHAHEQAGDAEGAKQNYILAQRAGQAVGPKNLSPEDQTAYFQVVKKIGDEAAQSGDLDTAIDSYHIYTESERSGVETLRTLAGLYERKYADTADPASMFSAIRVTEIALGIYDSSDRDLLERRGRYYRTVQPEELKPKADAMRKYIDVPWCLRNSKSSIENKNADTEMLEWGLHLAELALVMEPKSVSGLVLKARGLLMSGRRDEGLVILEDLREQKPESFASADDEDAWYTANRILGRMYLDEFSKPDFAIGCFKEFQKSSKSGADTDYFLGLCYEGTGDLKRAERQFQKVLSFDNHPRVPDARQALYRVQDMMRNGPNSALPS